MWCDAGVSVPREGPSPGWLMIAKKIRRGDYLGKAWGKSSTSLERMAAKTRAEASATIRNLRSLRTESWNRYLLDLCRD
ncbi:MAG: hypothetical protein CCU27_03045 [Nitrospira sp. UW-LDO-02]|nr:MAG: hypothetical protein CCU27_03045 [Nitrospira sp. UW-LDO-02]SLM45312.1 hypothetical protein NSND_62745 [Nitrospira sp. ND1]